MRKTTIPKSQTAICRVPAHHPRAKRSNSKQFDGRIGSWPTCKIHHLSIQTFTVHGEADGACNYSLRGRLSTSRQLRHPLFKPPQSFLVRICDYLCAYLAARTLCTSHYGNKKKLFFHPSSPLHPPNTAPTHFTVREDATVCSDALRFRRQNHICRVLGNQSCIHIVS